MLSQQHRVVSIGRHGEGVVADLREQALPWNDHPLRSAEILIHAAAAVRTDILAIHENIAIATNVSWGLPKTIRAVVLVSSTSVYSPSQSVITEATTPQPQDSYGFAKLAIEQQFISIAKSTNVPIVIMRPCSVYGPQDPHRKAITVFAECVRRGEHPKLSGNYAMRRDYIHVKDAARAICHAVQAANQGRSGIYNICSGNSWSPAEIANMLCELAHLAPMTLPLRPDLTHHFQFDQSHAAHEIGFRATIDIHAGLLELLRGPEGRVE